MDIDAVERARARIALQRLCRTHLYDPNVSLIDIGFKTMRGRPDRDRIALRVHVAEKMTNAQLERTAKGRDTARVPGHVDGIETDVLQATYRAQWWPWSGRGWPKSSVDPRRTRIDPLQGGVSVSRSGRYGAGTLGGVVFDRSSGDPMLLSNWHVLVANWASRPGIGIYQPAGLDGGTPDDLVARYARDAMGANLDAAVATIEDARRLSALQYQVGSVNGRTAPVREMRVVKSGRTTGVTRGEISGLDGVMAMRYGSIKRQIRRIVTIDPLDPNGVISEGGDSGSLYLDEQSHACVALHFAGSNVPERALAIDVNAVVDALSVDFR